MRDREQLQSDIEDVLEDYGVSIKGTHLVHALMDTIEGGRVELKFLGRKDESALVQANLYIAEQHRDGWVLLDLIQGEDFHAREVAIVTMAKGLGGRVTHG